MSHCLIQSNNLPATGHREISSNALISVNSCTFQVLLILSAAASYTTRGYHTTPNRTLPHPTDPTAPYSTYRPYRTHQTLQTLQTLQQPHTLLYRAEKSKSLSVLCMRNALDPVDARTENLAVPLESPPPGNKIQSIVNEENNGRNY